MTGLDQIFCMRYFLCIWRAPSKIFVHFFLLWPPQKGRSIRSGCFFQKCCAHNIFGMVFSLYKSRNLSPCQKCCTYNIYGRPLQIILTGDLSHARLLCAKCCTCSNFSRVIQPQPHVSAVYLCISMLQQMIMKHCSHGYESIESRCSSPIPRLETLCCLKFVSRVCE